MPRESSRLPKEPLRTSNRATIDKGLPSACGSSSRVTQRVIRRFATSTRGSCELQYSVCVLDRARLSQQTIGGKPSKLLICQSRLTRAVTSGRAATRMMAAIWGSVIPRRGNDGVPLDDDIGAGLPLRQLVDAVEEQGRERLGIAADGRTRSGCACSISANNALDA